MEITTIRFDKPEDLNVILGQTHFIKSVEDLHEALVTASPVARFGVAFCEASGPCLVRWSGNDQELIDVLASAELDTGPISPGERRQIKSFIDDRFLERRAQEERLKRRI